MLVNNLVLYAESMRLSSWLTYKTKTMTPSSQILSTVLSERAIHLYLLEECAYVNDFGNSLC